ncbi:hypothetical protein INR49_026188 [Caranx melampygus]|nr:hypothetical protein INR49_026220 [Caranx melampygus]KAG7240932.1 hypothetical protein INR49_026188 [Caranx melampygus]
MVFISRWEFSLLTYEFRSCPDFIPDILRRLVLKDQHQISLWTFTRTVPTQGPLSLSFQLHHTDIAVV